MKLIGKWMWAHGAISSVSWRRPGRGDRWPSPGSRGVSGDLLPVRGDTLPSSVKAWPGRTAVVVRPGASTSPLSPASWLGSSRSILPRTRRDGPAEVLLAETSGLAQVKTEDSSTAPGTSHGSYGNARRADGTSLVAASMMPEPSAIGWPVRGGVRHGPAGGDSPGELPNHEFTDPVGFRPPRRVSGSWPGSYARPCRSRNGRIAATHFCGYSSWSMCVDSGMKS